MEYIFPRIHYRAGNPTVNDDSTKGFVQGQLFENTVTKEKFFCYDNTAGAAVWYKFVNSLDPNETTAPSAQTQINTSRTQRNAFITPQIYYQDNVIDYDITIYSNAFSAGPITVDDGFTVTIGTSGTWTIV